MQEKGRLIFLKGISGREKISRLLFAGISLFILLTTILCTYFALQWANKPFAGFLINERMVIGNVGQYDWTGTEAGLNYPDKIIKANGAPVSSMADLDQVVDMLEIGTPVTYTVERSGTLREVSIRTMRFSLADFMVIVGTYLFAGIFYLVISIVVFVLKPDAKVSWIFLLACGGLSIYYVTAFDIQSTHLGFIRLYMSVSALLPAAIMHLSLNFPEQKKVSQRYPFLQFIPYVVAAVLIASLLVIYPNPLYARIYGSVIPPFMLLGAVALLASVFHSFIRSQSVIARQRAKVVLFGIALAGPIPALVMILSNLGITIGNVEILNNFLVFPILAFPASIAYAIAKHNLFDVDVYIKRTLGYIIMTALVGITYFILQLFVRNVLLEPILGDMADNIYPVIFALLVVFLFNPVNNRIQVWVDMLFFRAAVDYKHIIAEISNAFTSVMQIDEVILRMLQTMNRSLFLENASVMLLAGGDKAGQTLYYTGSGQNLEIRSEENASTSDESLLRLLADEKKLITSYDIAEDPKYGATKEACRESMDRLMASLAVPLVYKEKLIGLLALGNKKSGRFFSREDVDLLATLANQGAVALENARLFEENIEKTRMEEELKIAHDIQISMLPEQSPDIAGYSIAASSFSAREVGGDFYDFIEMGQDDEKKLGIIVGDVSGKAVSGALVMAASRSIFRVLADAKASVRDMVLQGNIRLKHDVKKGMFVALSYALLDPINKKMTIVNAGQTQPILCSNLSSEPQYIDPEGDRFPLGIIEDCDYQEAEVSLKSGDTVVFYTDGIVEAMNETGDMYGFDRFIEVIEENKRFEADEFLRNLMADVTRFVGDAEQHDDLTIVAVKVD
ncbi:SpoIIE family protein phosphatase [Thermodesulfobacteriota bacterium]